MKILALSQLFMVTESVTAGAFNGTGHTLPPALTGILLTGARIPLAYLLTAVPGAGAERHLVEHHAFEHFEGDGVAAMVLVFPAAAPSLKGGLVLFARILENFFCNLCVFWGKCINLASELYDMYIV